jgi:hypothetical protein
MGARREAMTGRDVGKDIGSDGGGYARSTDSLRAAKATGSNAYTSTSAYLEEIYMSQSEGFVAPGQEQKVCRLIKYLYGLKKALRAWYIKIDKHNLEKGFTRFPFDSNIYLKENDGGDCNSHSIR